MVLGGKMVLWSVILLLVAGSFGKCLMKLLMILLIVTLLVSLELGISSGLLGLIFFLTYVSGMMMLFTYMFCLFSNSFKFLSSSWNSVSSGLIIMGSLLLFFYKKKEVIWEDSGDELGVFIDSEWLFLGSFFTSLFMMALWMVFKVLCMKNGCLRPFF